MEDVMLEKIEGYRDNRLVFIMINGIVIHGSIADCDYMMVTEKMTKAQVRKNFPELSGKI